MSPPHAERALNAARVDLLMAGNPAYVPVLLPHDGGQPEIGPLIVSTLPAAAKSARTMVHEPVDIVIVGREAAGRHLRYTVYDAAGQDRLLRRDEVQEASISSAQFL